MAARELLRLSRSETDKLEALENMIYVLAFNGLPIGGDLSGRSTYLQRRAILTKTNRGIVGADFTTETC
jgi:ABC-type antimicrobial peptide transport system ATPase subunit